MAVARVLVCYSSSLIFLLILLPLITRFATILSLQARYKRDLDSFVEKHDIERVIETKKVFHLCLTLPCALILTPTHFPTTYYDQGS